MNKDLVSIIVPAYNHGIYIADTLNSIASQTYQNWECIICDDGSTDNTYEVVTSFLEKDSRFKYYWKRNGGLASARNYAIKNSKGKFLIPLDSDDVILPKYIELSNYTFLQNPNLKLVITGKGELGNSDNRSYYERFSFKQLCYQNQLSCTGMFKRIDYDTTKGYREEMKYGYEDWDFWMQLLKSETDYEIINEQLFLIRNSPNAMHIKLTQDNLKEMEMRRLLHKNNRRFIRTFAPELLPNKYKRHIVQLLKQIVNYFSR